MAICLLLALPLLAAMHRFQSIPFNAIATGALNAGTLPPSFFATSIQVCCPQTVTDFPPPSVNPGAYGHPTALHWSWIEPARGQYDWARFDEYINAAKSRGLVDANSAVFGMFVLSGTPGWAVADQTSCKVNVIGLTVCTAPPDNIQDWIDFLTAVTYHYDGVTAPHVKYYEIWN